ncbi:MAG TPA: hypothetical protein VGE07_25320 [Herpetosiphonaceae bacterium]
MGASAWTCATAYQPDIQAAYRAARHEAFVTEDYFKPWDFYDHVARPDPFPATIDALLDYAGLDGTHSILDWPGDTSLQPWSAEALRRVFGTEEPTPEQVETAANAADLRFWDSIDGDYLVAYEGGAPVQIIFMGRAAISGDDGAASRRKRSEESLCTPFRQRGDGRLAAGCSWPARLGSAGCWGPAASSAEPPAS